MKIEKDLYCLLCTAEVEKYYQHRNYRYYRCTNCKSVMMDPEDRLSFDKEKERYDQHNNDVEDPGYRRFVKPMVEEILKNYKLNSKGLDYGSGSGPVAAVMLKEKGLGVNLYDPFYYPDTGVLENKYDFIICSEVIEHFYRPAKEFETLKALLNSGGTLFCMTKLLQDGIDFANWQYKNDPTHVFFYHPAGLEWIKKKLGFSSLLIKKRLVYFIM